MGPLQLSRGVLPLRAPIMGIQGCAILGGWSNLAYRLHPKATRTKWVPSKEHAFFFMKRLDLSTRRGERGKLDMHFCTKSPLDIHTSTREKMVSFVSTYGYLKGFSCKNACRIFRVRLGAWIDPSVSALLFSAIIQRYYFSAIISALFQRYFSALFQRYFSALFQRYYSALLFQRYFSALFQKQYNFAFIFQRYFI